MCLGDNRRVTHGEMGVISGRRVPSRRWAVGLLLGGATVAQILSAAISPLLTRLYSPGDFGVLAVYGSIVSLLIVIAALRYELAVPLARDAHEAASVGAAAAIVAILSALCVAVLVLSVGEAVLAKLNASVMVPFAWLLPIGVLGGSLYRLLSHWALREREYRILASTRMTQSLVQAGVQIGFGFVSAGPLGLLAGDAIGRSGGSLRLARKIWAQHRESIRSITWKSIWTAAVTYRRFPLVSSFSVLFNNAALQLGPLAIAWLHGPVVAGWFALAQRVVGIPMRLVGEAVAQVYLSEAAALVREDVAAVWPIFKKTAWRLFAFSLLPASVIAAAGSPVFGMLFGSGWGKAGLYAQLLLPMFVGQIVASPLSQTLNVIGSLELQFAWDAGRLFVVAGVFIFARNLQLSPEATLLAYSTAMFIAYAILIAISGWALATQVGVATAGARPAGTSPSHAGLG